MLQISSGGHAMVVERQLIEAVEIALRNDTTRLATAIDQGRD